MKSLRIASVLRKSCQALILVIMTVVSGSGTAIVAAAEQNPDVLVTPLRFTSISLDQGLSQSVVNVTYQDSQGYLWFGTQDGLNRYDGYTFTIFRPDPDNPSSLSDRFINDIIEDRQGGFWVGTTTGGLNRYDLATGNFSHLFKDPNNPDGLSGNCIRTLQIDQQGMLWIGSDGGLDIYDPQDNIFIAHYLNHSEDPSSFFNYGVNDIYIDHAGVMWIAFNEGLAYFDQASGSFFHFINNPNDPASLMKASVWQIYEDQYFDLWLGTELGLERMDRQTHTFTHFVPDPTKSGNLSNPSVHAITEDSDGNMWVGTADGLNLLDRQTGRFTIYRHMESDPNSLSNSIILSLYKDKEGILWIGTFGGGVSKLDPGYNKFPILQYDRIIPKDISSFGLIEDHTGELWFTMYGIGLLRLNRETGKYTIYRSDLNDPDNSLLDNFVWTVNESRDGTIWIGSHSGLNALNPDTEQFIHYQMDGSNADDPYNLGGGAAGYTLEDSQGYLWIAMSTGVDCLDRSTGIFTHYRHDPKDPNSLSDPNVSYIYESQAGELWLGMYEGGLSKLDRETGQFTHFHHDPLNPQSISSDEVLVITQDHTGRMWLGTNEGLNLFDPQSGTATHYTVKDGLPNDVIYGIVEDDQGYLWLSTNYGLSRFDPNKGNFHNYDYNDGLQANEFNSLAFGKTRAGEIIFAGINGTNIFQPAEIQNNDYLPPIVLTQLTQGGEPVKIEQASDGLSKVTLYWPHNYFEFAFTALSYSNPEKNKYAYKLDNFDQDWISSGSYNFARYTNLPGGTYTLQIKGSNNDGLWNETGTAITVAVIPPIWQTWWFRALAVILVVGGVFAVYRLRMRSMESYNRDLQRQVDERTKKIETLFEQTKELAIVEERNRLARDLHDSAKQKAFAALAQLGAVRSILNKEPNAAKSHLDEVENLVYEVIQELTFLIQEMYPMALKDKGLAVVLREYLYEWENRNDIHVNLSVNHERQLPLEIEQALYRISQESLANIARHSSASKVDIELNYNGDTVEMLLNDNGCGFNLSQKPAGVGLRTMRERATMIGGEITIDSTPGKGTLVQVSVPITPPAITNPKGNNGGNNDSPNNHPARG
jgi:signal transduction histidine kinase/ligand-binding sensor domain-containing protein